MGNNLRVEEWLANAQKSPKRRRFQLVGKGLVRKAAAKSPFDDSEVWGELCRVNTKASQTELQTALPGTKDEKVQKRPHVAWRMLAKPVDRYHSAVIGDCDFAEALRGDSELSLPAMAP